MQILADSSSGQNAKLRIGNDIKKQMMFYERVVKRDSVKLLSSKSVMLLGLGNSYCYARKLKADFPNIEEIFVLCSQWEYNACKAFAEENEFFNLVSVDDIPLECEDDKIEERELESLRTQLNLRYMKKFDMVIANPPYNFGTSQTQLHLKLMNVVLSSNILREGGEIVSIQPVNWLLSPIDYKYNARSYKNFAYLRKRITNIDFISKKEASQMFDMDIINPVGIYTFSMESEDAFDVYDFMRRYGRIDNTGFFEKVVCECYEGKIKSFNDVKVSHDKYEKYHCYLSEVYGVPGEKGFFDLVSTNYETVREFPKKGKKNPVINFNSDEEAENFRSTLSLPFYKYVNWCYKKNNWQTLNKYPWMGEAINPRTGIVGYKGEWTDDDLFDYFDISLEERETARENLRKSIEEYV